MSDTKYFVEGGHTLLYSIPGSIFYGILAEMVHRGARGASGTNCMPDPSDLRPATIEDFDDFRVCHKGHLA